MHRDDLVERHSPTPGFLLRPAEPLDCVAVLLVALALQLLDLFGRSQPAELERRRLLLLHRSQCGPGRAPGQSTPELLHGKSPFVSPMDRVHLHAAISFK